MKLKEFKRPVLDGGYGNYYFKLYDGSQTKKFDELKEFNNDLGCFEICDKKGHIVEYMDLMGNFSKRPTSFARHFNNYINSRHMGVRYSTPPNCLYYTYIIDFPSRYFINKNVREVIKSEEEERYNRACKNGSLRGMLEKLGYKMYVDKVFKQKLKRAKYIKSKIKVDMNKEIDIEGHVLAM